MRERDQSVVRVVFECCSDGFGSISLLSPSTEKVELFLELFGNSLVRAHTADFLRNKATELIK